jgi:UDP-glucuronate decarboxylase
MSHPKQAIVKDDIRAIVARDLPWEQLSGCQVVVTGAAGFLGGYLVSSLLALYRLGKVAQPVRVVALVRDVDRARQRFADLPDTSGLEFRRWDLNTIAVPDLGDTQYVLHAASQASPRFYGTDPVGTLLPNTVGTAALLEALQRAPNPRGMLFVSSGEVYGAVSSDKALSEESYGVVDPASVRACYAESKRAGETLCVAWHAQYKLPTFIARPFHTYGPGLSAEDGRVFCDFAYNVARDENIAMQSDGSARRAFCYVSDAVAGLLTVLLKGTPAQAYNVANPVGEMSVAELADLLVSLYPEKRLTVDRRAVQDTTKYLPSAYSRLVPDVSRLQHLGWQAFVDPAVGFKRMVESIQI